MVWVSIQTMIIDIEKLIDPADEYRLQNLSPEHYQTPETYLCKWRLESRMEIFSSVDGVTQELIDSCRERTTLSIYYHGGVEAGRYRKFSPEVVFNKENSEVVYVGGYCHLRRSRRILRVDRISMA